MQLKKSRWKSIEAVFNSTRPETSNEYHIYIVGYHPPAFRAFTICIRDRHANSEAHPLRSIHMAMILVCFYTERGSKIF